MLNRFTDIRPHLLLVVSLLAGAQAAAQAPSLVIYPSRPAPGAMVRLTLTGTAGQGDSVELISGRMSGEELHFVKSAPNKWHAIGPVRVDAIGDVPAEVIVEFASGRLDTVTASVTLPRPKPVKPGAPSRARTLAVAPRFTSPMSAETQARIARENASARELGRRAHGTAPMWTAPFLRPRDATVTSRFGTGRVFNGTLTSRHLGVDFRGGTGDPVRAANRGVVALVDEFYLAGSVIYLDHGGGVLTAYFHLSKPLVRTGDTVERGQEIGLVGSTGRVTGPHLHWSARYGEVTVNPMDLLTAASPR